MKLHIDHVVLWVADAARALAFYEEVFELETVRKTEFLAGKAAFPSVRLSDETILDLMPRAAVPLLEAGVAAAGGTPGTAGHPINHVCLTTDHDSFDRLRTRLTERNIRMSHVMEQQFGAKGLAAGAFYMQDPDGNIVEIRHYD